MNLSQKTLAIIAASMALLMGSMYAAARFGVMGKFLNLEQREMRNSVERSKNALSDNLSDVASTTNDYGAWDRTYTFAQNPVGDFPHEEFKDATLQGLGINLIVLIDTSGHVLYAKYYDLVHKQEKYGTKAVRAIASSQWVHKIGTSSTPASGLLVLPDGPVLVAVCPILTTERKGPARGIVIMARDIDHTFVSLLSTQLRLSLAIWLASDAHLPADFQAEQPGLDFQTDSIAVRAWNNDVVAGYSALKDVGGDSVLLMRIDSPRDIFRQGISTLNYFLGILCFFTVVLGLGTIALLRYTVLGRLIHLNSQIGEIGAKRDLAMRVSSSGTDEISKLGATVNLMLDGLQNGDSHFRKIAENIRQVFWVKDEPTQEIAYISPPWESPSGISREQLFAGSSRLWLNSVYPEDRPIVEQMLKRQEEGIKGKAEYRIVGPGGDTWWAWCRYFPVFDDVGRLTQTIGLSEDITEHKLTETVLQRSQDDLWNVMFSASNSAN